MEANILPLACILPHALKMIHWGPLVSARIMFHLAMIILKVQRSKRAYTIAFHSSSFQSFFSFLVLPAICAVLGCRRDAS